MSQSRKERKLIEVDSTAESFFLYESYGRKGCDLSGTRSAWEKYDSGKQIKIMPPIKPPFTIGSKFISKTHGRAGIYLGAVGKNWRWVLRFRDEGKYKEGNSTKKKMAGDFEIDYNLFKKARIYKISDTYP